MKKEDFTVDIGYRVRLIHTKDRFTRLRKGDTGTIGNITIIPDGHGGELGIQIWVKWDRYPNETFALVEGSSKWEVIERK